MNKEPENKDLNTADDADHSTKERQPLFVIALQILAFLAHWYRPYSAPYAELKHKCSRRLNLITTLMKNITLSSVLLFTVILVCGTNITRVIVGWNAVMLLYAVPFSFLFFSQRRIANAKIATSEYNLSIYTSTGAERFAFNITQSSCRRAVISISLDKYVKNIIFPCYHFPGNHRRCAGEN